MFVKIKKLKKKKKKKKREKKSSTSQKCASTIPMFHTKIMQVKLSTCDSQLSGFSQVSDKID